MVSFSRFAAAIDGYKTYLAGAAILLIGLLQAGGVISQADALTAITPLVGLIPIFLRLAVDKSNAQIAERVTKAVDGALQFGGALRIRSSEPIDSKSLQPLDLDRLATRLKSEFQARRLEPLDLVEPVFGKTLAELDQQERDLHSILAGLKRARLELQAAEQERLAADLSVTGATPISPLMLLALLFIGGTAIAEDASPVSRGRLSDAVYRPKLTYPVAQAATAIPQPTTIIAPPVDLALMGKIIGPDGDKIYTGQMVKLRAALTVTSEGTTRDLLESPQDECPTAYQWELSNPPDGYDLQAWIDPGGRGVAFATDKPGEYCFVLAISKWTGGPQPLLRMARYKLTVVARTVSQTPTAPRPPPTDPPLNPGSPPLSPTNPPLNPQDPPADPTDADLSGKFGLATKLRDKIRELVPEDYRDRSSKLAEVYRKVAAMVIAGEVGLLNASSKVQALNAAALPAADERKAWTPLLNWLSDEFSTMATQGRLLSKRDVVIALSEVSLGFTLLSVTEGE